MGIDCARVGWRSCLDVTEATQPKMFIMLITVTWL